MDLLLQPSIIPGTTAEREESILGFLAIEGHQSLSALESLTRLKMFESPMQFNAEMLIEGLCFHMFPHRVWIISVHPTLIIFSQSWLMTIICFSFSSTLYRYSFATLAKVVHLRSQQWGLRNNNVFWTFWAEVQNPSLATTWQCCGNNGVAGSQNGGNLRAEVKLRVNYGELILLIAGE